jgi:hypothetical protein
MALQLTGRRREEVSVSRSYVETNAESLARLKRLVSSLTEAQMLTPMSDGWTVAAYFGHLAFWDRRVSRLVDRWLVQGYEATTYDPHIMNDAMKPSLLLVPPMAAAAEMIAAAEEADHLVATLPDALLEQVVAGTGASVQRSNHRNMHLAEFEALFG